MDFRIYRIYFIVIDDYIIQFNNNYKEFLFKIILKSEYIEFVVELVEEDIIKWKITVIVLKLEKQKTHDKLN